MASPLPEELWLSILSQVLGEDIYEIFALHVKPEDTQFRSFLRVSSAFRRITLQIASIALGTPLEPPTDVRLADPCINTRFTGMC